MLTGTGLTLISMVAKNLLATMALITDCPTEIAFTLAVEPLPSNSTLSIPVSFHQETSEYPSGTVNVIISDDPRTNDKDAGRASILP